MHIKLQFQRFESCCFLHLFNAIIANRLMTLDSSYSTRDRAKGLNDRLLTSERRFGVWFKFNKQGKRSTPSNKHIPVLVPSPTSSSSPSGLLEHFTPPLCRPEEFNKEVVLIHDEFLFVRPVHGLEDRRRIFIKKDSAREASNPPPQTR